MFSTVDTIVAIATPPGRGGIGVVRLSGPEALPIAGRLVADGRPLLPRHATLTSIRPHVSTGAEGSIDRGPIDQAVVTYFPAPHSYTGEAIVEISAHGSPVVLRAIVRSAIDAGARAAEPGEFTLRAFLNGRIDLTQAEAIADLIDAATPLQARAAFDQLQGTLGQAIAEIDRALFDLMARLEASVDFPEEGFHFIDVDTLSARIADIGSRVDRLLRDARRGRLLREGLQIAIVGLPNVGKSSLFNALVGASRAIVTDVPGTTRDLVSETIDLEGLRVTLVDTAGLRETDDVVESEGVRRSQGAAATADLVLRVLDRSRPRCQCEPLLTEKRTLVVATKCDLAPAWSRDDVVEVSALSGDGVETLRRRIVEALDIELVPDRPAITNIRHIALLERARAALGSARAAADGRILSEEFVLADLEDARSAFEEVTGRRAPEDVLAHIFERFCVGK
jgi:tRNA modification GTPase